MSSLKRTSQVKVPLKQIDRRCSNNDFYNQKQEILQETTSDYLLPTQSDVARKIQNKLRVRRATGSQQRISRENQERTNTTDKLQEDLDPIEEFQQRLDYLWENSEEVGNAVKIAIMFIDPKELKAKIIKEWGLVQCQLGGHELQQVIKTRIQKAGEMAKTTKRCRDQQDLVGRKFQERMKKLGELLKSR